MYSGQGLVPTDTQREPDEERVEGRCFISSTLPWKAWLTNVTWRCSTSFLSLGRNQRAENHGRHGRAKSFLWPGFMFVTGRPLVLHNYDGSRRRSPVCTGERLRLHTSSKQDFHPGCISLLVTRVNEHYKHHATFNWTGVGLMQRLGCHTSDWCFSCWHFSFTVAEIWWHVKSQRGCLIHPSLYSMRLKVLEFS